MQQREKTTRANIGKSVHVTLFSGTVLVRRLGRTLGEWLPRAGGPHILVAGIVIQTGKHGPRGVQLELYMDTNYALKAADRRSISGGVVMCAGWWLCMFFSPGCRHALRFRRWHRSVANGEFEIIPARQQSSTSIILPSRCTRRRFVVCLHSPMGSILQGGCLSSI